MSVALVNPYGFSGSVGSDVTPAAVNWTDVTVSDFESGTETSITQTISGIDAPITLELSWTVVGDTPNIVVYRNGAYATGGTTSPKTFVANNGDQIFFVFAIGGGTAGKYATGVCTVKNNSDGAATLDTFNYAVRYVYWPYGPFY